MCPLLTETGVYGFIVPSPKQADLHRDGRYAMHSFPLEDNEDAFYLSGVARHVSDPETHGRLGRQFAAERAQFALPPPGQEQHLFEFRLEAALATRTTGHRHPTPEPTVRSSGHRPPRTPRPVQAVNL